MAYSCLAWGQRPADTLAAAAREVSPLQTDRPDVTESAYAVPQGHFQLEMDVLRYFTSDGTVFTANIWQAGNLLLKYAPLPGVDVQLQFTAYQNERMITTDTLNPGLVVTSDITESYFLQEPIVLRVKINLLGQRGGKWAVGVLPFGQLPIYSKRTENNWLLGAACIVSYAPNDNWTLAGQLQGQAYRQRLSASQREAGERGDQATDWLASLTVGRTITGRLGAFIEVAATLTPLGDNPVRPDDLLPQLDWGLTYDLGQHSPMRLDLGAYHGLTPRTPTSLYLGYSVRL